MNLQQLFFEQIKNKVPDNISIVDEIAGLLNLSDDSVYRRIRGDKELSFTEINTLARHFDISIDSILSLSDNNQVIFNDFKIDQDTLTFEQYLTGLIGYLENLQKLEDVEIIYSAKDFPLFHYFQFPKLAAFKLFFWKKSVLNFEELRNTKFSAELDFPELEIGKRAISLYYNLPCTEIWSEEIINGTLRQLAFYHESSFFENNALIFEILDELEQMILHLKLMAREGRKFLYGMENEPKGNFNLYFNEMILANNSLMVRVNENRKVYLTYNELNYISTTNEDFCLNYHNSLKSLSARSTYISSSSEKIRNIFFNKLLTKMEKFKSGLDKS